MVQIPTNNTILTVALFQEYTTNYYFKNTSNSYYSATTLSTLPSIIKNVEVNLNAMLNGRLYKRYPPGDVQFNGYKNLTPQMEADTLYECLTECVEYRLITQQYVNLNNSYSGTVNGSNAYQTQNNNVIGLRQDITAKLTMLGLYANALIGDVKPKAVVDNPGEDNGKLINYANLQLWYSTFSQHNWSFSAPITFENNITFLGDVNAMDFNANNIVANNINSTNGNFTNLNVSNVNGLTDIHATLNGINYSFPKTSLYLNTPWGLSLSDGSFFAMSIGDNTTTSSFEVLGGYTINNPTMEINSTTITSLTVIKCHYQTVNSLSATTLASASGYDSTNNAININSMLKALYPTPSWSGTISQEQLNNLGINSTSTTNLLGIQQVVDKVVGKVNILTTLTSYNGITGITSVIDPLFQEVGTTTGIPIYNNNTLSLTGSFVFTNYSTGTISPIYTSAVSSLGQVNSPSQVVSQINILLDVYLTVILLNG